MWHELFIAIALVLVIEGVLPFLSPRAVRQLLLQMAEMEDRALRFTGLASMILGVVLLYALRG